MSLSGQQRQKLQEALISAFPSKSSLAQMLSFQLDKSLIEFDRGETLPDIVFNVITTAEAKHWVEKLIQGSLKSNPENQLLKNIAAELLSEPEPELPIATPSITAETNSSAKNPDFDLQFPKYLEQLRNCTEGDFEKITKYFEYITIIDKDHVGIEGLIQKLVNTDELKSIILSGGQGTGKSIFLSSLYSALDKNIFSKRKIYPLFLNSSYFFGINNSSNKSEKYVRDLNRYIDENTNCNFALLVDGLSGREREASERIYRQIINILDLSRIDSVIWSVSDGFEVNLLKILDDNMKQYRTSFKNFSVQIKPIKIERNKLENNDFINNFIFLYEIVNEKKHQSHSDVKSDLIERLESIFQNEEVVDQHIISLVYEKVYDDNYSNLTNLSRFLERYCCDYLSENETIPNRLIYRCLCAPAKLAYKHVVSSFHKGNIPDNLKIENQPEQKYLDLINSHNNLRDFLAAWYIYDLISNPGKYSDEIQEDQIGYDFPQVINSFIRELITRDRRTREKGFKGIERILEIIRSRQANNRSLHQTENILIYLLGRWTQDIGLARDLIKQGLIQHYIEDSNPDINQILKVRCSNAVSNYSERIQIKTLLRTAFVSLIKLGDEESTKKFFSALLRDSELSSIDRGYHRIYYGDDMAYKDTVPDCYVDKNNTSWDKSYEALKNKIDRDLKLKHIKSSTQHNIFTLISFIQNRLDDELYKNHRDILNIRLRYVANVLSKILEGNYQLHSGFRQYFEMFLIDLNRNDLSHWRFIVDLYRLKWMPRNGWLLRKIEQSFKFGRIESVADHSLMTVLLARFLLPECANDFKGYSDYDKNPNIYQNYNRDSIIHKLSFHDLPESYTGDIVKHILNPEERVKANKNTEKALGYIRFKETYKRLYFTHDTSTNNEEFETVENKELKKVNATNISNNISMESPSINDKLARDIDKLENLIQLYIYNELYPDVIGENDFKNFKNSLLKTQTSFFDKLSYDFVVWAEQSKDKITHWMNEYLSEEILVSNSNSEISEIKDLSIDHDIDSDVLEWFKSQGQSYKERINSVLRQYKETH